MGISIQFLMLQEHYSGVLQRVNKNLSSSFPFDIFWLGLNLVVEKNQIYHEKSDIWAWSMTCIEMFSLSQNQVYSPDNQPPGCPPSLWKMIQQGLDKDPSKRPSFKDLIKQFSTNRLSRPIANPIQGTNSDEPGYVLTHTDSYSQLYFNVSEENQKPPASHNSSSGVYNNASHNSSSGVYNNASRNSSRQNNYHNATNTPPHV